MQPSMDAAATKAAAGLTAEAAAENRDRKLDELQAVGAIYPDELSGDAALLTFTQGGVEADELGLLADPSADALEFGLTLAVDDAETGASLAVLSLHVALPAGYPSSAAAEFRGSIKRSTADARYRDLEELSLELSSLLLQLCLDARGEEAVCEVANAALGEPLVGWKSGRVAVSSSAADWRVLLLYLAKTL